MRGRLTRALTATLLAASLGASLSACVEPTDEGRGTSAGASTGAPASGTRGHAGPGHGHPGIPDCRAGELPAEADEVIDAIGAGGPFRHRGKDGSTFQNRERLLPDERRGYYREYTVDTPGESDRGARRIITGGDSERSPQHWYYTSDHYDSFCELTPGG